MGRFYNDTFFDNIKNVSDLPWKEKYGLMEQLA